MVTLLLCLALGQAAETASHRDRGRAFLERGDIAAALPELRAAVAANPSDVIAQDSLGVALRESGQAEAAVAVFGSVGWAPSGASVFPSRRRP